MQTFKPKLLLCEKGPDASELYVYLHSTTSVDSPSTPTSAPRAECSYKQSTASRMVLYIEMYTYTTMNECWIGPENVLSEFQYAKAKPSESCKADEQWQYY